MKEEQNEMIFNNINERRAKCKLNINCFILITVSFKLLSIANMFDYFSKSEEELKLENKKFGHFECNTIYSWRLSRCMVDNILLILINENKIINKIL